MRKLLIMVFFLLFGAGMHAQQTYRINTDDDTDDGVCNDLHCSLREAINASNVDGIGSLLWFEIPGTGTKTIHLDSELPTITEFNLAIDGTTQEGNLSSNGRVIIDGSHNILNGIHIQTHGVRVYGLQMQNFKENAILVKSATLDTLSSVEIGRGNKGNTFVSNGTALKAVNINSLVFKGNYVGTNFSFEQNLGNQNGVVVDNNWAFYEDAEILIGGRIDEGEKNYFANCSQSAIRLSYQGSAKIEGNTFGTGVNGNERLGNFIAVESSNGRGLIDIGGSARTKNIFAYNESAVIIDRNSYVLVSENSFYCNDLALNIIENAYPIPIIQSGVETVLTGIAQPYDFVEIYITDAQTCNSEDCQGMLFLGTVRANGDGVWQFPDFFQFGQQVVALSRNNGRQSTFSDCLRICPSLINTYSGNSGPYCADDSIFLKGKANISGFQWVTSFTNDEVEYFWTGPNGYLSTEKDPLDATLAGNYILETSLFGCPSKADTTAVSFTNITISIQEETPFCEAENISLSSQVITNSPLINYHWTGPNGYESIEQNPSDITESGIYYLIVSGGGCNSETDSVNIVNHLPVPFSLGEKAFICEGESIKFDIVGYDYYQWQGDFLISCDTCEKIEIFPTKDGIIQLSAGSSVGCVKTVEAAIEILHPISVVEERILCTGSSMEIFGKIINTAGSYSSNFVGTNGCDSIHTIILVQPEENVVFEKRIICKGETMSVFGKDYSDSGVYQSNFLASNGCDSTHIIELEVLEKIEVSQKNAICEGESIDVFGEMVNNSGVFTKVFPSFNGCDSIHTISVIVNIIHRVKEKRTICAGESTELFGEQTIDESGVFQKKFVASNGCDSIHIIELEILEPIETASIISICEGDEVLVFEKLINKNSQQSQNYTTLTGCDSVHTVTVSILQPTFTQSVISICQEECNSFYGAKVCTDKIFIQTFNGAAGCDSVHSTILEIIKPIETFKEYTICHGDSLAVLGTYLKTEGKFSKSFTSNYGCDSMHTVILNISEPIEVNINTKSSCIGQMNGEIEIFLKGGIAPYAINWSDANLPNSKALSGLAYGAYELTVTDFLKCQFIQKIKIDTSSFPVFEQEIQDVSCYGANDGAIIFNSNQALSYRLNGGAFIQTGQYYDLIPEEYEVLVKDESGCEYYQNFVIKQPPKLTVDLLEEVTINLGESIVLDPIVNYYKPVSYEWNEVLTISCVECQNPVVSPLKDTKYQLTVFDEFNCESQAEIWVRVDTNKDLFIPNVFSPNNDGENDNFTILAPEGPVSEVDVFRIFDRWGTLLYEAQKFEPNNDQFGWNGKFNGTEMDNGVYIYFAVVKFKDGTETLLKGDITIAK